MNEHTKRIERVCRPIENFEAFRRTPDPETLGISFRALAPNIYLHLYKEAGVHYFKAKDLPGRFVTVHVGDTDGAHRPPKSVFERLTRKEQPPRREYDDENGVAKDGLLKEKVSYTDDFSDALADLIGRHLRFQIENGVME